MKWLTFLKDQRGAGAMSVVLGFMALAIPAVTATLAFTATSSIASREARNTTGAQFTVAGAMDYAVYKLVKVDGFKGSLSPGVPSYEIITLNDTDGAITWTKRNLPGGVPPEEEIFLSTTLVVDTATVEPNTPTQVTYTIEVTNIGEATVSVDDVRDAVPWGVTYVNGSTTGATNDDPIASWRASGEGGIPYLQLVWSLGTQLAPGASLVVEFDATIDAPTGWLCNKAWATPGGQQSGSGPSAKIQVGTPAGSLCTGEAIEVRKTVTPEIGSAGVQTVYTYRIEIENHDSVSHDYPWIVDILPPGLAYIGGSATGNIGFGWVWGRNPFITPHPSGHSLYWNFMLPWQYVNAGQTKYLEFQTQGALAQGVHRNEVWVYTSWIDDHVYSFPTAEIYVWDVYDIVVANDKTSVTAQVWLGSGDTYHVTQWEVTGPLE